MASGVSGCGKAGFDLPKADARKRNRIVSLPLRSGNVLYVSLDPARFFFLPRSLSCA